MKRYLRLWGAFIKNCLIREIEFRGNFVIQSILSILWACVNFSFVYLIFEHIESLAGWTRDEVILLAVVCYVPNCLYKIFIKGNITLMSWFVGNGKMDSILLQPVNSLFVVSSRYTSFSQIPRFFVFLYLLVTLPFQTNPALLWTEWFVAVVLIFLGLLGMYSLTVIINCYSFWKPRVWNVWCIGDRLEDLAQQPVDIYKGAMKAVVYVLPIAIFATVPTKFLLGEGSITLFLYSFAVSMSSFVLAQIVWKAGLKKYESASS